MKHLVELRFRPTLIIALDETGERICEQLQSIVRSTGFDPVLCQSVALLMVDSQSQQARPAALCGCFADTLAPQEEGSLSRMIDLTLHDIQNYRRIQAITAEGYPIPDTRTQIFIAGDVHSDALPRTLEVVNQRLRRRRLKALVCYFANAYSLCQMTGSLNSGPLFLDDEADGDAHADRGYGNREERLAPDFCFLFEDMRTHPTEAFLDAAVSYYATAEAIFALLATGISTEPVFVQHTQGHVPFQAYENVGSLSTCLIAFPQTHLLEYCSASLGIDLMEQWDSDLRTQHASSGELEGLQRQASQKVQELRDAVSDRYERPFANNPSPSRRADKEGLLVEELLCPGLTILQNGAAAPLRNVALTSAEARGLLHGQQRARSELGRTTSILFRLFWPDDIAEEFQRRKLRPASWCQLVFERGSRAVKAYSDWDKQAARTWDMLSNRVIAEIREAVDSLWSKDQNGFELAITYVGELDDQLAKLADDQSSWREEHQKRYLRFRAAWKEQVASWIHSESEAGTGAGQAVPTMQNRLVADQSDIDDASSTAANQSALLAGGAAAMPTAAFQHLPEEEERILRGLELRVESHQARLPSWWAQGVLALPLALAVSLTILALLPGHVLTARQPPVLTIAAVCASVGCALALLQIGFHMFSAHRLKIYQEDLLIFYRRYYAYKCEQREDRLRVTRLMTPLRIAVQRIRERLDNIQPFIEQTREKLREQTELIEQEVFESASGQRDIFVANGERLQRTKKNTLADFASQVSKLRVQNPVEDWHQSSADLKRQLIRQFRQQPQSLMEMRNEDAQRQIREFATAVSRAYLHGPLTDLRPALDKEDIWLDAIDQVEAPLYQIRVGSKKQALLFVCGRTQDIADGLQYMQRDVYTARIGNDHKWVLLVSFFQGGLPAAVDPELLFPLRSQAPASSFDASLADRGGDHASGGPEPDKDPDESLPV